MLCPEEMAAMINAVSIALSKNRSIEEINILSAAFTQIGDTLATIAVQRTNICSFTENKNRTSNQTDIL